MRPLFRPIPLSTALKSPREATRWPLTPDLTAGAGFPPQPPAPQSQSPKHSAQKRGCSELPPPRRPCPWPRFPPRGVSSRGAERAGRSSGGRASPCPGLCGVWFRGCSGRRGGMARDVSGCSPCTRSCGGVVLRLSVSVVDRDGIPGDVGVGRAGHGLGHSALPKRGVIPGETLVPPELVSDPRPAPPIT